MGSLYGFDIKSELPLRRLNAAAGTRGELTIAAAAGPLTEPEQEPTGARIDDDGFCWFAAYPLADGGCLLRMPPTGSFLLEPDAGRIVVDSTDEDAELLEHRVASTAVCTLLSMRDDLVLHAAAVERDGEAIVFCGPSLRGKSTLARALGEAGCRLLGEDGIAIELGAPAAIVHPGARGVRMRNRDENGRNRTVLLEDPGHGEAEPCPVASVVLLSERGTEFEAGRLQPARALALLTPSLIHSGGRTAVAAAFQRLAALLGAVPAFEVSLPDDLEALPETCQRFLDSSRIPG